VKIFTDQTVIQLLGSTFDYAGNFFLTGITTAATMVAPLAMTPERTSSFSSQTSTMTAQTPFKSLLRRSDHNEDAAADVTHSLMQESDYLPPLYKRRQRKVRFHKTILNRRIPHLNDMSQRLRESTWIQPDEYLEIRQRCIATLRIMALGEASIELMENEDFCPRGLEGKTREGSLRRREYKADSINAVLEEQQLLWNEEINDDEAIMEAYQMFSIPCAEDAYERGALDEAAIEEYLTEDQCSYSESNYSVSELLEPGMVEKIADVLFLQSQRAALLKEIEDNFYEESSIERRRKCEEAHHYKSKINQSLSMSLRDFFSQRRDANHVQSKSKAEDGVDPQEDDLPSLAWDEEDSSNGSSLAWSDSNLESFTSELSDVFHCRKKRQSLLAEIERNCFIDPKVVVETPSNVASLAATLKCGLSFVFRQDANVGTNQETN
jgi:hypothetical protein